MIKWIIGALLLTAFVFFGLVKKKKKRTYSYDNDEDPLAGKHEIWTSDVIDDDIDDRYFENDWSSTDYNVNDFNNKNY